jgi:hypothetical protein
VDQTYLYEANITHNLGKMAQEAGIYMHLWRPEEIGITQAKELIKPLLDGLEKMEADPEGYSKFDSPNGWGLYKNFVPWVRRYVEACKKYPEAKIEVSR